MAYFYRAVLQCTIVGYWYRTLSKCCRSCSMGVRIRGTLGDRDPLNKVPFKRAISRAKGEEGSPLKGLPNTTEE